MYPPMFLQKKQIGRLFWNKENWINKEKPTTRLALSRNPFPQKSQMNGFTTEPLWYSKCLRKLIFLRKAFSHWLHLCSSSSVWVLRWSCMVRLRLNLRKKINELPLDGWNCACLNSFQMVYPNPQMSHLCGRWSECTVMCVNRPPRCVKLMPHNSQVNFRTAAMKTHSERVSHKWKWRKFNLRAFGGGGGFFSRFGGDALCRSLIWLSRWMFRRKRL